MQIRTDYQNMQNDDLLLELKKRVFVLGETTPTYVDVDVAAKYKDNEVYLGQYLEHQPGFEIKLPKEHGLKNEIKWSEDEQCDIVIINSEHPQYRDLLIQFLQSPFIFSGAYNEEVSQDEYLEDYDEDGFPISDSGPLEPIISDDMDPIDVSDLCSDDYTLSDSE